jgi:hypothetical protein
MLYDRDWGALPAHAQHSKSVRAQVLSVLLLYLQMGYIAYLVLFTACAAVIAQPTSSHSNCTKDNRYTTHTASSNSLVIAVK